MTNEVVHNSKIYNKLLFDPGFSSFDAFENDWQVMKMCRFWKSTSSLWHNQRYIVKLNHLCLIYGRTYALWSK